MHELFFSIPWHFHTPSPIPLLTSTILRRLFKGHHYFSPQLLFPHSFLSGIRNSAGFIECSTSTDKTLHHSLPITGRTDLCEPQTKLPLHHPGGDQEGMHEAWSLCEYNAPISASICYSPVFRDRYVLSLVQYISQNRPKVLTSEEARKIVSQEDSH